LLLPDGRFWSVIPSLREASHQLVCMFQSGTISWISTGNRIGQPNVTRCTFRFGAADVNIGALP